jgi:hypothetical protein
MKIYNQQSQSCPQEAINPTYKKPLIPHHMQAIKILKCA